MKRAIFLMTVLISVNVYSQYTDNQPKEVANTLSLTKTRQQVEEAIKGLVVDPELYNNLWKNYIEDIFEQNGWNFLNDANIQFKTFQTEGNPDATLGLTYDIDIDYAKFVAKGNKRISNEFGFSATGNISFAKSYNPTDFLEAKVNYRYAVFAGGVVKQSDAQVFTELNTLGTALTGLDMQSEEAKKLWMEFSQKLQFTNQFYYAFSGKTGFESNQDFTKKQFTPGIVIDAGMKAWNNNSALAKFNILDYPFALIRYILGTDSKLTAYGATLPTAQIGFDYVVPAEDEVREALIGNTDPFPRLKFETGFRTFIARFEKQNIFFNANYRYYHELRADAAVSDAGLDSHSYFVMALQTTAGLYVSYANGKLPFDAISDEVYSIGFNYKFN